MIDLLHQLVAIKSLSREESAIADFLRTELMRAGLAVERQGNNLWCQFGGSPRPRLLLNSHIDTVPPGQGWTGDPWTPRSERERLIGLGANDAKGCVAALVGAFLALARAYATQQRLAGTLVLALTAEEEISGQGLATILDRIGPLDAAIVGEPTGLTPMIAQRGLLILKGTARGRTAHPASTPPEQAANAIMTAAADVMRLRDFDFGPAHPLLGRTHAHVTMFNGGIARNVIPDVCEYFVDVRTTPGEAHRALYERLRRYVASELTIHSERLVPVETAPNATIVRAIRSVLPERRPAGSPAMSDMVFLAGIPTVKIGPGESARSHTPDEYVLESEIEQAAAAYGAIVNAYFELAAVNQPAMTQALASAAAN